MRDRSQCYNDPTRMADFVRRNALLATVFITGACVLVIEIVALRFLSPYYGNTIFTASSVISVILTALSVGYYAGGKLSDRAPSRVHFFGIIFVSGLSVIALFALGRVLLPFFSMSLSLMLGPLISSIALFLAPAILLGMLSPYAVKLQSVEAPGEGIGSIAGRIFFWSTLGSIGGSLLAGFVLIPHFGVDNILVGTGVVLCVLGGVPLIARGFGGKRLSVYIIMVLAPSSALWLAGSDVRADVVYEKDGVYEKITIYEREIEGRPVRFFQQDMSDSGSMYLDSDDPTDLTAEYTKYYSVYRVFNPAIRNALVIGGGAYSIPKALLAELPDVQVDVAEIEPSLFELAKKYFNAEVDPRLTNYTEDGRRLLRDTGKKYDYIFSDVYYSLFSIPAHFTTQEFFATAKQSLAPEGIFVANLIGDLSRRQPSLIMSEIKTFRSVFPNSYFFAVDDPASSAPQNIIFVGYNSDTRIGLNDPALLASDDPVIRALSSKLIDVARFDLTPYPVLTDNFAPVEFLTANVLSRAMHVTNADVDGEEMLALIDQQLRYGPRYIGSRGHERMQKFLIDEMSALSEDVRIQSFEYTAQSGESRTLKNVIARFYPERRERIILGTHYDSKKHADRDWLDQGPVPGANDSASGVAALVEIARFLKNTPVFPDVGVDIVFFDGEEGDEDQGSDYEKWSPLGSTYFAGRVSELYAGVLPHAAVVLDMVCDKNLQIQKERSSVQSAPEHVELFWDSAQRVNNGVFKNNVGYDIEDDHTPLAKAGIPSFLVIDFDYPYFHTTADTLDKCSAESLGTVARATLGYIYSLR